MFNENVGYLWTVQNLTSKNDWIKLTKLKKNVSKYKIALGIKISKHEQLKYQNNQMKFTNI